MRPALLLVIGLLACAQGSGVAIQPAERIPEGWRYGGPGAGAEGVDGMVVTDAALATEVGVEVLRAGGNAVDAAIATAFALAVVYPEAGNLGGGGFMVAHMADGAQAALDFREKAPLGATRDMYLDASGEPTDASVTGHLASGVPGSVMGLWEAHQRFGTRPWAELVAPAIALARDGFEVNRRLHDTILDDSSRLARFQASAALFLPGGAPPPVGSTWRNPDLAAVLERIAQRGVAGFYEGETADLIVAEMRRGGGLITHDDLRGYQAIWRDPVSFRYRDLQIISMPPASSGGLTLALIANILEGWPASPEEWHTPLMLHRVAEAMRRAFADRNEFLGDPDFADVPADRFVSDEYAASLRATIDSMRATPSSAVRPGLEPAGAESDHTTHFSIVDAAGNAVALTTTINELYGSAVTVAGAGFLLNDEMDDFTAKVGEPNMYGLVQGEANAIEPGKRMLSAMTPTIVLDPTGEPLIVTGARGGPRIISAAFQVISNIVDYGMSAELAVHAPRIHHQHLPDILYFEEGGLAPEDSAALAAMGYDVRPRDSVANAPTILRSAGRWIGVPDPRTGGYAEGF